MLQIGIVGLPNVGKSTLFQALTKKQVDTSNYPFATIDPNVGVVAVPDPRLVKLTELSRSKKTIPAFIEFVDIAGLVKGAAKGEGLGNTFLSHIREVDAIVEVVRAFPAGGGSASGGEVTHIYNRINPEEDRDIIHTELVLADLDTAERAVSRQEKEAKMGGERERKKLEVYKHIQQHLATGKLASDFIVSDEESTKAIYELQLLTSKPILFTINVLDTEDAKAKETLDIFGVEHSILLNIKLEDEIAQIDENTDEFKNMSHIDNLIKKAYEVLGLIAFFTTGEDETRAWAIPKSSTAPRAGRAIHSDFEEKFIRAEVISYDNLLKAGSYAKARELGLLQTKGKEYIVQDGDVVEFKV